VINIISLYNDVALDSANKDENGSLSIARFNRFSKRAELLLMDWLTGDVAGKIPPAPWLTQKNKDWLAPFIVKKLDQVTGGRIARPEDYYGYDNFYRIAGLAPGASCNEDEEDELLTPLGNPAITILDGDEFNYRVNTWIEELKPTFDVPIAKIIGKEFELSPFDLGSVGLEYIRYPVYGNIVPMPDPAYNDEVPNPALSQDYQWDESVRSVLIYCITNMYSDNTREQALKQFNAATGKTTRDERG
jgi:hypothetical protein